LSRLTRITTTLRPARDQLADRNVFARRLLESAEQKIKTKDANLTLEPEPTVDILAEIAKHARKSNDPKKNGTPPYCVGFAAESENVEQYGSEKRRSKRIALLIANHAMSIFWSDESGACLIKASANEAKDKLIRLPRMGKVALAREIVSQVAAKNLNVAL
jgi:phosphopantothenoylcysteine decarboxylase / phosphopantothenate---cysteine ligase